MTTISLTQEFERFLSYLFQFLQVFSTNVPDSGYLCFKSMETKCQENHLKEHPVKCELISDLLPGPQTSFLIPK